MTQQSMPKVKKRMIRAVIKYLITKGSTKASVVLRKDKVDKSDTRFAKKKG